MCNLQELNSKSVFMESMHRKPRKSIVGPDVCLRRGQPCGDDAQKVLQGKISGQSVRVDVLDIDCYRRLVSVIWLGSRHINEEMVAEGWGWAYRKY